MPFYGSWLNRTEAQFTAPRYFALDGTDHPSHREQASMVRRCIAWRDRHITDPRLRKVVKRTETINGPRMPDAVLVALPAAPGIAPGVATGRRGAPR